MENYNDLSFYEISEKELVSASLKHLRHQCQGHPCIHY